MARKIIIGVGIANYPVAAAGNTWAFLQWALAFRDAGWDVWLAEEVESAKCIDDDYKKIDFPHSANRRHWKSTLAEFGLNEQSTLFVDHQAANRHALLQFAKEAELFLNISGHFKDREILDATAHRVYVDLDPAFTQIWAEVYKSNMNFAGHDSFVSVGMRMGAPDCLAPSMGIRWIPTLPPVSLDHWTNPDPSSPGKNWTTVTHWYGYPAIEYNGQWYDNKSAEFVKLLQLPARTREKLEIATDLTPDLQEHKDFTSAGWHLTLARPLNTPWQKYRDYLATSRGEFCVAKNGYVRSRCGWFSDRSVCYLALGRPVVLQETGWSEFLPAGEGLLSFTDADSAAHALNSVAADYEKHARAARQIAERHCAGPVVVNRLLENLGK
jgi:hypothetical protein